MGGCGVAGWCRWVRGEGNLCDRRAHGRCVGEAGLGPGQQVVEHAVQLEADRGDLWGVCSVQIVVHR